MNSIFCYTLTSVGVMFSTIQRVYEQLFYICEMQRFRQVFDFYINSSIHVSLAVVALAFITGMSLHISVDIPLLLFLFFGSVTGYNFVKYAEVAGLHHRSLATSLRAIQVFSAVCGIAMVVTLYYLRWEVLLMCIFLALLTALYAVPFLIINKTRLNLRNIAGFKIYVIAMVWAITTVALPVLQSGLEMYWDVWIVLIQRFLFVLALMIPFEIRDLLYDSTQLKTLPQQLGVKRTQFVGITWLLLFFFLEFLKDELEESWLLVHMGVVVLLGLGILLSRKRQNPYYASFWIEGLPLLWLWMALVTSSYFC